MTVRGTATGHSRLLVLGYHNIESTWRWPSAPGLGARTFARHMRVLTRIANVVPLDAALMDLYEGRPLPSRAVAITFDDGYRDNLTTAVPILRQRGLPATVFLVPDFLSRHRQAWWERLAWAIRAARAGELQFRGTRYPLRTPEDHEPVISSVEAELKRLDVHDREKELESLVDSLDPTREIAVDDLFLDWDSAAQLARSVSIGSHTMGHAIMAREDVATQVSDLTRSRELLSGRCGASVPGLAYPNGTRDDYDERTVESARQAGYSFAVTTTAGCTSPETPPFEVRRRIVDSTKPIRNFAARVLLDLTADPAA